MILEKINLGVVELTMALHLAFNLPQDKLIWDVGHQSYTHKILTGRKNQFDQLRKFGGMSGFPKRNESHFDAFDTGHSSTSISAGLGLVKARDLKNEHYSVVSVIGDGALTGGMAYEALNNASSLRTNFIIVLRLLRMSAEFHICLVTLDHQILIMILRKMWLIPCIRFRVETISLIKLRKPRVI